MITSRRRSPTLPRRTALAGSLLFAAGAARLGKAAAAPPALRLGVLVFGSVQWVASVILRHGLDRAHGFVLQTQRMANNDTARVALLGGSADVVVSDWLFVGAERARGIDLRFSVFSSATGALVLGRNSPVRSFRDLDGRRLGVAGGPYDKSWMIVRAVARRQQGIDLARAAHIAYGAPPLLNAKLQQGGLDAVLTYWNYVAPLEVAGFSPLITVSACAEDLGLPPHPPILGYVFNGTWAAANEKLINGFLAASTDAEAILLRSDAEWDAVRPLMNAPDDALFRRLRAGFRAGISHVPPAEVEKVADRLFAIVHSEGGDAATGGLTSLPSGVFWPAPA